MEGFRNYLPCKSEKLNATENNTQVMDFSSMEEISWEAQTYKEDFNIIITKGVMLLWD